MNENPPKGAVLLSDYLVKNGEAATPQTTQKGLPPGAILLSGNPNKTRSATPREYTPPHEPRVGEMLKGAANTVKNIVTKPSDLLHRGMNAVADVNAPQITGGDVAETLTGLAETPGVVLSGISSFLASLGATGYIGSL